MWAITLLLAVFCGFTAIMYHHNVMLIWAAFFMIMTIIIAIIEHTSWFNIKPNEVDDYLDTFK